MSERYEGPLLDGMTGLWKGHPALLTKIADGIGAGQWRLVRTDKADALMPMRDYEVREKFTPVFPMKSSKALRPMVGMKFTFARYLDGRNTKDADVCEIRMAEPVGTDFGGYGSREIWDAGCFDIISIPSPSSSPQKAEAMCTDGHEWLNPDVDGMCRIEVAPNIFCEAYRKEAVPHRCKGAPCGTFSLSFPSGWDTWGPEERMSKHATGTRIYCSPECRDRAGATTVGSVKKFDRALSEEEVVREMAARGPAPAAAPACLGAPCGVEWDRYMTDMRIPKADWTGDGESVIGAVLRCPGCRVAARAALAASDEAKRAATYTCANAGCASTGPFGIRAMCWSCTDACERGQGIARRVAQEIIAAAMPAKKQPPRFPEPYRPPVGVGLGASMGGLWKGRPHG